MGFWSSELIYAFPNTGLRLETLSRLRPPEDDGVTRTDDYLSIGTREKSVLFTYPHMENLRTMILAAWRTFPRLWRRVDGEWIVRKERHGKAAGCRGEALVLAPALVDPRVEGGSPERGVRVLLNSEEHAVRIREEDLGAWAGIVRTYSLHAASRFLLAQGWSRFRYRAPLAQLDRASVS